MVDDEGSRRKIQAKILRNEPGQLWERSVRHRER